VNCGSLADRFLAYTYAEIKFFNDISAIFCRISKIMVPLKSANFSASDWPLKTIFLDRKRFGQVKSEKNITLSLHIRRSISTKFCTMIEMVHAFISPWIQSIV